MLNLRKFQMKTVSWLLLILVYSITNLIVKHIQLRSLKDCIEQQQINNDSIYKQMKVENSSGARGYRKERMEQQDLNMAEFFQQWTLGTENENILHFRLQTKWLFHQTQGKFIEAYVLINWAEKLRTFKMEVKLWKKISYNNSYQNVEQMKQELTVKHKYIMNSPSNIFVLQQVVN